MEWRWSQWRTWRTHMSFKATSIIDSSWRWTSSMHGAWSSMTGLSCWTRTISSFKRPTSSFSVVSSVLCSSILASFTRVCLFFRYYYRYSNFWDLITKTTNSGWIGMLNNCNALIVLLMIVFVRFNVIIHRENLFMNWSYTGGLLYILLSIVWNFQSSLQLHKYGDEIF